MIESRYLLAWPGVAAAVPAGALALGILVGLFHPTDVYSGSLVVVVVLLLLGATGATGGVWFLVGFLPADLLLRPASWSPDVSKPGLVIADLVLALLLVLIAAATPRLRTQLLLWWSGLRVGRTVRDLSVSAWVVEVVGGAAAYTLLAWSWLQSVPALVRPVYIWAGRVPDIEAVRPIQDNVVLLTLLAALAGAVMAGVEWRSRQDSAAGASGSMVYLIDQSEPAREQRTYPAWLRYVVMAVLGVLIGAGLLSSVVDALLLAGVVVLGLYVRQRVSRLTAWSRLVWRLPDVLRMAAVIVAIAVLGVLVLPLVFDAATSLLPVLLLTAIGLLLAAFALPARERE